MKNFDEKIRDKLYDAEMPVASGVWDSIEKNLDRKDKRPVIWLMLLMLLTGLPALYFSAYYEADAQTDHSLIMAETNQNMSDAVRSISYSEAESSLKQTEELELLATRRANRVKSLAKKEKQALGFQIASGTKNTLMNSMLESAENSSIIYEALALNKPSVLEYESTTIFDESSFSFTEREEALFGTKTECPRFRQQWPLLYSFTDISLSHPSQSLTTQLNESSDLLDLRAQSESSLPSFGIRTGLGYDFYNGLFVQAGIAYNQINMKFLHRQEDVINNKTSIVIDTLFNSEGEILSITRDTTVVQEIGIKETKGTNTFRMIDIPVEIGYHYPLSNKFSLRASVGLALNIRTVSAGYMLDANAETFRYDSRDRDYFRTRTGLSYLANLAIETQVSGNMYLNAGIRWRHYGTEFNAADNPIEQRFTSFGLNAGIRYRL